MAVARKMGARYMECSSKEMTGVEEIFTEAINTVVINDRSNQQTTSSSPNAPPGTSGSQGVMIPKKKKRSCRFL